MKNSDPRVDAYIENAADFARPILEKIRAWYHMACPDIEENIKWGVPSFEKEGMVGGMAAFKKHVTIGFWRSKDVKEAAKILEKQSLASFGSLRIESLKDLPKAADFKAAVKKAVALNLEQAALPKAKRTKAAAKKLPVKIPPELTAALKKNKKAREVFEAFPPSCKREYAEWIAEAKREATRERRLATAIEWISEGKRRNWKYENC